MRAAPASAVVATAATAGLAASPLESIRELSGDLCVPAPADRRRERPDTAGLTVFKRRLHRRWAAKMSTITGVLDYVQCKMFELFWIAVLYLNYLYPQISRIVEYVSHAVYFSEPELVTNMI